jgi:hypothetical protein
MNPIDEIFQREGLFDKLVIPHGLVAGSINLNFNSHNSTKFVILIVLLGFQRGCTNPSADGCDLHGII